MSFYQQAPQIQNTWAHDLVLQKYLKRKLGHLSDKEKIFSHLNRCGELAATEWLRLANECERQPPVLVNFDPWGGRIDEIRTSNAWKEMQNIAAREGVVATAYERTYAELSRVYQMSLLYLYHSSSALFSCPLAMTDGAARLLETQGQTPEQKKAFQNLTSREEKKFWTSGQWMTEKSGGSDVSGTETVAKTYRALSDAAPAGTWSHNLYGTKWFTSSANSPMALMLARPEDASAGSSGLALFYAETHKTDGRLNEIEMHRLKDKLGTKSLPTAELTLQGTPGQMIGNVGEGVRRIATILNITRIYNSVCALSQMRRALDWLQDFSLKRFAFGKPIAEQPLHRKLLQDLETQFQNVFSFVFSIVELLGKEEALVATAEEKAQLRMLTPVLKLYSARICLQVVTEVVEGFGGAGYVEDTGIPQLLRDAQVLCIWEGTTNVLSLDFLRALRDPACTAELEKMLSASSLKSQVRRVKEVLSLSTQQREVFESCARELSFLVAEIWIEQNSALR